MRKSGQKNKPPVKAEKSCVLTLAGAGISIRAAWRPKDAEIFIKAFTAQAMRQA